MFVRGTLFALAFAPGLALAAGTADWEDFGQRGEFKRKGATFSCMLPIKAGSTWEDLFNQRDQPCLFFGQADAAIAIGSLAKPLLASLGPPIANQPGTAGSRSHFFRFGDGDNPPFFVVSVVDERIAALQISGPADTTGLDNLSFSGLRLGSSEEQLRKRFGAPLRTAAGSTPGAEMWSYLPWTFSFEVTGGRVTSIRIANQDLR